MKTDSFEPVFPQNGSPTNVGFLATVSYVVLNIIFDLCASCVLVEMYQWFVVPVWGLPVPSAPQVFGMLLMLSCVQTSVAPPPYLTENSLKVKQSIHIAGKFVVLIIAYGLAFVISQVM